MSDFTVLVKRMNKNHCFVLDGDKSRVFIDSFDPLLNRKFYNSVSVQTFREMYESGEVWCGESITGKGIVKSPANAWLFSDKRRQYLGGVFFDPSGKQHNDKLNLWRGYSVTPKKGGWSLIKNHIKSIICSDNKLLFDYVIRWLALTLQRPENQTEVALVLQGKKGCGKGILGHLIRGFFNTHGMHITSCKHLTGSFNRHLRDCAFLFVDEALWAGDRQHEGVLKGIITEPMLTIEGKGANAYQAKNMLTLLMASNDAWVVPASVDERRFCVVEVNQKMIGNREYFNKLVSESKNTDSQAAMLYDLLNYDLSDFQVRDIPETEALKEQRLHSMDSMGQWWINVLQRGYLFNSKSKHNDFMDWIDKASSSLIRDSYMQFCTEQKLSKYDIKDERTLGKFLSKHYKKTRSRGSFLVGEMKDGMPYFSQHERIYHYDLGGLNDCRDIFCENEKLNFDFDLT